MLAKCLNILLINPLAAECDRVGFCYS
jgi:hypothetical protein